MSVTPETTKTAYGDESVRMAGAPPFYMMGVALIPDSVQIDPELFRRIMPKGSRKLHWRDMNEGLQRRSLQLLSGVERADLVVIASPLMGRKQERAQEVPGGAAALPRRARHRPPGPGKQEAHRRQARHRLRQVREGLQDRPVDRGRSRERRGRAQALDSRPGARRHGRLPDEDRRLGVLEGRLGSPRRQRRAD